MVETEKLVDQEKVNALIHACTKDAIDLKCNLLETAHAAKSVLVCACARMGINVQEILREQKVDASETLAVPEEDVLDRGRGD